MRSLFCCSPRCLTVEPVFGGFDEVGKVESRNLIELRLRLVSLDNLPESFIKILLKIPLTIKTDLSHSGLFLLGIDN